MATVLTPTPPRAKPSGDAKLTHELAQAAKRIRVVDAAAGGLALAVLTLAYTLVAVLADRWLQLPAEARLAGVSLFALAFAATAYLLLVRPIRRQVNPRYAARQVEQAIPDAKNAVINWVDLQDEKLAESVRASLTRRAYDQVSAAEVARVAESRRVVWLGAAAGLLLAAMAVLLIVFKPTPFWSLVNRAYNPFTQSGIATRTGIILESPAGGDLTVTGGDPVVVKIRLTGSVPDKKGADKPRLLVRYTLDAEATDEVPLETLESGRDWGLQLPPSVVQNGFYYTVAAGDARTAEYRVTVRPRPFVKAFEVRLTPPAYTRMREEVTQEPRIIGLRGTKVVLTATTNRPAQSGWLRFDNLASEVVAERVPEQPEQLRYSFTLTESANYRVGFATTDGETSEPSAAFSVLVEADARPVVTIELPKEEEVTLPANGTLAVDGLATDDFGVRSIALKMRVLGATPTPLSPRPYQAGKSLKREKDGSYPTRVEYRDSQPLGELKAEAGEPFKLAEGMVVEYFLEAVDTNTEPHIPGANVGRSKAQRVKVGPPTPEPQADPKRQEQEKQHQKEQDQKFDQEQRDPPPPKNGEQQPPQEKQEKGGEPKEGDQGGQPKEGQQPGNKSQTGGKGSEQPKNGETPPQPPMGAPNEGANGSQQNSTGAKPPETPMNPMGTPPQQPTGQPNDGSGGKPPETQPNPQPGANGSDPQGGKPPPSPEQKAEAEKNKREAERVQQEIDKQNQQAGAARPPEPSAGEPNQPEAEPSSRKEQPKGADRQTPPNEGPRPEAGEKQPPQGGQEGGASEPKSGGKPAPQSAGTPDPMTKANGGSDTKPTQPGPDDRGGERPAQEQPGGQANNAGEAKPQKATAPNESKDKPAGNPGQPEQKPEPKPGANAPEPGEAKPNNAANPGANGQGQPHMDPKELAETVKDLKSGDKEKADAARNKLDKAMGKANREAAEKKAEQLERDLKSDDPATKKAAEDELKEMAKQADANQKTTQEAGAKPGSEKPAVPEPGENGGKPQQPPEANPSNTEGGTPPKPADPMGKQPGAGGSKPAKPPEQGSVGTSPKTGDKPRDGSGSENGLNPAERPKGTDAGQTDPKKGGTDVQPAQPKPGPQPGKPDGTKPDGTKPDGTKPDGTKPDGTKPDGTKPDGTKPDGTKPDGTKPDGTKPDGTKPDGTKPDGTKPDGTKPDGTKPDGTKPDGTKPDGTKPDGTKPDGTKPDGTKPDGTGAASEEKPTDPKQASQKGAGGEKPGEPEPKPGTEQQDPMGGGDNAKPAGDQAGAGKPSGKRAPTAEEVKEFQDKARDLDSKDDAKRKAAEKAVDDAVGQERRKQMQQDAKDLREGTPEQQQAARERVEKTMRDAAKNPPADPKEWKPGNAQGAESPGDKLVANERNRLKSAELQLQEFEKNRYNQELLKNLGYTPAQYEEFLKAQQKAFEQQRADLAKLEAEVAKTPTGPATQKVGGGEKVTQRPGAAAGPGGNGSPGVAPPGFSDAQKKFAEEAAKLKRGQRAN